MKKLFASRKALAATTLLAAAVTLGTGQLVWNQAVAQDAASRLPQPGLS